MVAGTAVGLWVYVAIGWYAASLAGALVSAVVVIATTLRSRERFDFARLAEGRS